MKKILFSASTEMLSDVDKNKVGSSCEVINIIDLEHLNALKGSKNYKIWIVHPCPSFVIGERIIDYLPNLELIITPTTGTTHIDIVSLERKGIKVIGLKGTSVVNEIKASSEFTFIHILNALRKFSNSIDHVKSGRWRDGDSELRGNEVCESVIGIVGLGRIGGNVAKWLKCMGAKVIYYDPYVENSEYERYDNLLEMVSFANVLVVSVHLSKETQGMIDLNVFKNMRSDSYIVNTSRGEVIVEEDLIYALKNHLIRGASVDVLCDENDIEFLEKNSLIKFSKLFPSLIITPHVAGLTYESESKAQMFAYNEAIKHL